MTSKSKRTLTQADLLFLIDGFSKIFATKQDLADLRQEFSHLPTKEEFYQRMDLLTGELRDEREENTIQQAKLEDHESRLSKLETSLNLSAA